MPVGSGVDQLSLDLRFFQLQVVVLRLVMLVVGGFQRREWSGCAMVAVVPYLFVLGMVPQLIVVCVKVRRL